MTQLAADTRPILWAVRIGGEVILTGETPVGTVTVTGHDIVGSADENEFLGALVGQAGAYDPLPDYGQPCEGGAIYGYNGSLVICRQSHNRTEHAPETIPALFAVYRENAGEALEWVAGEGVLVGTRRLYEGVLYECLQAHQTEFAPPLVPALWRVVTQGDEPQPWVQPTGAHDAYQLGDRVTYNGQTWESTINANVWAPGVYGWVVI